jgi:hypothetical protein
VAKNASGFYRFLAVINVILVVLYYCSHALGCTKQRKSSASCSSAATRHGHLTLQLPIVYLRARRIDFPISFGHDVLRKGNHYIFLSENGALIPIRLSPFSLHGQLFYLYLPIQVAKQDDEDERR